MGVLSLLQIPLEKILFILLHSLDQGSLWGSGHVGCSHVLNPLWTPGGVALVPSTEEAYLVCQHLGM